MSYLPAISADHSHYQHPLDRTFTRDFDIFKATQGVTYLDSEFLTNSAAAHTLYAQGRLAGAVVYHVFTDDDTEAQFRAIVSAIGPTPPDWLAGVMIDLETWRGTSYELSGDHSSRVNHLGGLTAQYMKSWRAAWIYANGGDAAELAPHRDRRFPFILADYSSTLAYKSYMSAIGQQYSDGETRWPVPKINGTYLPRSTAPFGNCDHNVFPGFANGRALRQWMRPVAAPKPPPKPAASPYDPRTTRTDTLTAPGGHYQLNLNDAGQLVMHHDGHVVRTIS